MKTQQEINTLKADWARDRAWDIEDTPGFEDHAEQLRAYRLGVEAAGAHEAAALERAALDALIKPGIKALEGTDLTAAKQAGSSLSVMLGAVAAMLLPVVERLRDAEAKNAEQADAIEILRDEVHELRRQNGRA